MKTVAIIDYGMGNLHSVSKAVEHVAPDTRVLVTDNAEQIRSADRVILPGVGAIRDCMAEIRRLGIDELVREVSADRPLLGICVGMQALMSHSEENGGVACLDVLPGQVAFFGEAHQSDDGERLKVPHMGWNAVRPAINHPLWRGIEPNTRFYFVHSYHVVPDNQAIIAGTFDYGLTGCAALAQENLFATQFHPEKSHTAGLTLLKNFLDWEGTCS